MLPFSPPAGSVYYYHNDGRSQWEHPAGYVAPNVQPVGYGISGYGERNSACSYHFSKQIQKIC